MSSLHLDLKAPPPCDSSQAAGLTLGKIWTLWTQFSTRGGQGRDILDDVVSTSAVPQEKLRSVQALLGLRSRRR